MATKAQTCPHQADYAFCLLLFPFSLIPFSFCEAGISTTVEDSLQISSFMQNKANLPEDQMNVNFYSTKDYGNISNCSLTENKANTNPIQSQTKPIYRGVASGEAGSEAKKCCSPPLCCGISKEKMISCNRLYRKYQID